MIFHHWFSVSSYLGDHFEGRFMMDHISHSANIKIRIVPLFFAMLCSADPHIPIPLKTDMCIRDSTLNLYTR